MALRRQRKRQVSLSAVKCSRCAFQLSDPRSLAGLSREYQKVPQVYVNHCKSVINFEIKLTVSSSDLVQLDNNVAIPGRFFMCNRPQIITRFESYNLVILSKINPLPKLGMIQVL